MGYGGDTLKKCIMIVPLLSCLFLFSCKDNNEISTIESSSIVTTSNTITTSEVTYYKVTFMNYDDSILKEINVIEGNTAVYDLDIPKKPSDDEFDYEFSGWDKELDNINEDIIVKALFTQKAKKDWSEIEWF